MVQNLPKSSIMQYEDRNKNFESDILRNYEAQLFKELLKLYQFIMKIRKIFTNEEIKYRIGVGSKKRDYLIEGVFSYEDLENEKFFYLQQISGQYSIRLHATQSQMQEIKEKNNNYATIEEYNKANSPNNNIYKKLFDFFNEGQKQALEEFKKEKGRGPNKEERRMLGEYQKQILGFKLGNRGNLYQVYRYLIDVIIPSSQQPIDFNDPQIFQITVGKAFSAVLSGGGKGGSALTGGDIAVKNKNGKVIQQVKGQMGRDPTLISLVSLINQTSDLIKALENFKETKSTEALQNLLIRKEADQKVINAARDQALDHLKQIKIK